MKNLSFPSSVFIAEGARITGNVILEESCSVWYNAVLRGDAEPIHIGKGSNVQDGCILHVDTGYPLFIGSSVTVGHGAILHGCTVEDESLIGMGAILLNGCRIGKNCMVGAGALVLQGMSVPDGSLVLGNPAKVVRFLREEEKQAVLRNAEEYRQKASQALASDFILSERRETSH